MTKEERLAKLAARAEELQKIEKELMRKGAMFIAGCDEVGRGPLAGPVVTACCVLPEDMDVTGIDDSKKLSEKRREELYERIVRNALAVGIGMEGPETIDEINILNATKEAMRKAYFDADKQLVARFGRGIDHLLVDAVELIAIGVPQTALVHGDSLSVSIAAASIVAKVTRDHLMQDYDKEYPGYGFASNKGYGTAEHYAGIKKMGITPIHRKSFLKNLSDH